jgi:ATP-dependent DNA ligase
MAKISVAVTFSHKEIERLCIQEAQATIWPVPGEEPLKGEWTVEHFYDGVRVKYARDDDENREEL